MQAAASLLPKLLLSSLQSQALPALSGAVRSKAHLAVTNVGSSTNIRWHEGAVCTQAKESLLDQRGAVVWFTGLSGSGKSTVACTLEHALAARGKLTANLDGDNIRHGLNSNLGFSPQDRAENIRRIGEVAKLFADSGMISLCSFISPYTADRDRVRARLQPGQFVEVYMRIPLSVCEARDPKGLYAKARAGKLKGMTGIDDPYEEPTNPELIIDAADPRTGLLRSPEAQAAQILAYLEDNNYLCANVPQMQAMG